jgi:hypothetical protein
MEHMSGWTAEDWDDWDDWCDNEPREEDETTEAVSARFHELVYYWPIEAILELIKKCHQKP